MSLALKWFSENAELIKYTGSYKTVKHFIKINDELHNKEESSVVKNYIPLESSTKDDTFNDGSHIKCEIKSYVVISTFSRCATVQ